MIHPVVEAIFKHETESPLRRAICFKSNVIDYAALAFFMKKGAAFLHDKYGIDKRDVVMISAVSKPEFVVLWLAALYLGATVISVDKSMTTMKILQLYDFVEPKVFLSSIKLDAEQRNVFFLRESYNHIVSMGYNPVVPTPATLDPEDITEIIFTTGTTGTPKGAMLSVNCVRAITINTVNGTKRNADDVELLPLPLNHSFGIRVLRALLYVGATVVLQNGFLFLKETLFNIENYNCNGMASVPASMDKLMRTMDEEGFKELFAGMKYVEISAGSLSVASKIRILKMLPNADIYNVWGSSETGGAIFLDIRRSLQHISSLGIPERGCEISFVTEEGKEISADSVKNAGRMIMSGPMCMSGYYKMPEETKSTLKDGAIYTNDIAYRDTDGFIYMLGRADDIINVGGEKVSPIEVENVCGMYKYVKECACIGVPDRDGEYETVPILFVVASSAKFDKKELVESAKKHLEPYKLPREIILVDEIPKNFMKKVDRKALRKNLSDNLLEGNNPVVNAIHSRRSVRKFTEQEISHEVLERIVECGIHAPSGHNMQSWHFAVITNGDMISEIKNVTREVAERKRVYFYGFDNPRALVMISNDRRNPYGIQDSSCAAQNIMLAAYSYGLGSVWLNPLMTLCDEPEIRDVLNRCGVPECYNVWAMIALGYPANDPAPLAKKKNVVSWIE